MYWLLVEVMDAPKGGLCWHTILGDWSAAITRGSAPAWLIRDVAQIPTGVGQHAIAFSDITEATHTHENASNLFAPIGYALVTNSSAGTVFVIDTDRLQKHADIALGIHPTSLDVASAIVYIAGCSVRFIDTNPEQLICVLYIGVSVIVLRYSVPVHAMRF